MKIRMKHNHDVVEEVSQTRGILTTLPDKTGWTNRGDRDGVLKFFSDSDWEPVPEEKWEDVTSCLTIGDPGIYHGDTCIARYACDRSFRAVPYRFVKRALWDVLPLHIKSMSQARWKDEQPLREACVLIVERNVSV